MNGKIIAGLITTLLTVLGWDDWYVHVQGAVDRWAQKEIDGASKKAGVKAELTVIGVKAADWIIDSLIQLALIEMRAKE